MQTQRNSNGSESGKYRPFVGVDYDANNIQPDAAEGEYLAKVEDVEVRASKKDQLPQLVVSWKLIEAHTDSDECQRSVDAKLMEYLTFFPDGDRRGNFGKRTFRAIREGLGLEEDILPTRLESPDDFEPLIEGMKASEGMVVWVKLEEDRENPNEKRARIAYTAPRGTLTTTETEDEEEEKPRAKAKPGKPTKPVQKGRR